MTGKHAADVPPDGAAPEASGGVAASDAVARNTEPKAEELPAPVAADAPAPAVTAARRHRRVTTDAVPGSDPRPAPEPPRHTNAENDDRLKADKPPHWG